MRRKALWFCAFKDLTEEKIYVSLKFSIFVIIAKIFMFNLFGAGFRFYYKSFGRKLQKISRSIVLNLIGDFEKVSMNIFCFQEIFI